MTHQAQVPAKVAAYFGCGSSPPYAEHPIVEQVYRPGVGWKTTNYRKRVSASWARKLRKEGVTVVALRYGRRLADFRIEEVVR